MRLSSSQVKEIKDSIANLLQCNHQIYLIGSRTKDHLKGGDIDLLLIVEAENIAEVTNLKFKMVDQIMAQKSIDETKVDIVITTKEALNSDTFVVTVNDDKILL